MAPGQNRRSEESTEDCYCPRRVTWEKLLRNSYKRPDQVSVSISREVLHQRLIRRWPFPSLVEPTNLGYISKLGVLADRHVHLEDFRAHCLKVVYAGASKDTFEAIKLSREGTVHAPFCVYTVTGAKLVKCYLEE